MFVYLVVNQVKSYSYPSRHTEFIQRRMNVNASSRRCIDVVANLYKQYASAWMLPLLIA